MRGSFGVAFTFLLVAGFGCSSSPSSNGESEVQPRVDSPPEESEDSVGAANNWRTKYTCPKDGKKYRGYELVRCLHLVKKEPCQHHVGARKPTKPPHVEDWWYEHYGDCPTHSGQGFGGVTCVGTP